MLDVVVEDQSIKKRGVEAFYTTSNPSMGNNPISTLFIYLSHLSSLLEFCKCIFLFPIHLLELFVLNAVKGSFQFIFVFLFVPSESVNWYFFLFCNLFLIIQENMGTCSAFYEELNNLRQIPIHHHFFKKTVLDSVKCISLSHTVIK